jgi:HAD superfamily hydrolase (TIGR01549 family)
MNYTKKSKVIKVIFFDFDGVILNSMPIRDYGFRKIFETYPKEKVDNLISYHQHNAGLSRFHKIKFFYNKILEQDITDRKINEYANIFSKIMRSELINKKYIISETVEFIKKNKNKDILMHIVSGSEQNELRFLCRELCIESYFSTIEGSPTHKNSLVSNIISKNKYNIKECILIGDSINDYEAASVNNIKFYGCNNEDLRNVAFYYINNFKEMNKKYI